MPEARSSRASGRPSALRVLAGLVHLGASCGGEPRAAPAERPHLVLIVLDTARADHFSSYGYAKPTTPHVDALAARGILFRRAHSVAPWTLPSHMSMFTGRLPREHGATWGAYDGAETASVRELITRPFVPREPALLLGARLRDAGYATFGFSGNPFVSRTQGFAHGFERFFELWREEERAAARGGPPRDAYEDTRTGAAVAGVARVLATRPPDRPCFLFLNVLDAHFPYLALEPFRAKFGVPETTRRALEESGPRAVLEMITGVPRFSHRSLAPAYDAALATADHAVGEVVRILESAGVFDDTLLIVTSDHGELLGEEGRFTHQLYVDEPLMHVPLVVKLPRDERAGTAVDSPLVSNLDVYATLLAAAGAGDEAPRGQAHDLLARPPVARRLLIGEYTPSRAYLRHLAAVNASFDLEAHLRGRYVVWADGFRTELVGPRAVRTTPSGGASDAPRLAAAAREAEDALAGYLALRTDEPGPRALVQDAGTWSQLEALGYVDGAVGE